MATEEKTEKPTPKKKKESRKEGQNARTLELGAWATMLVFAIAFDTVMGRVTSSFSTMIEESARVAESGSIVKAQEFLGDSLMTAMWMMLLVSVVAMFVGVLFAVSQGGFFLATKAIQPKASKLSLIQGAKRVFGLNALWEGSKTLLKAVILFAVVFAIGRDLYPLLSGLAEPTAVLAALGDVVGETLIAASVAGLILGAADYGFQRYRTGKQVRMTKDEVRREQKDSDGDPLIKSARRSAQMAMSRNRMMSAVADADVVIVNPVHYAVALGYDPEKGAPTVLAKGAGFVAENIRDKAAEADVTIVTDVPLSRALFSSCKVDQEIPGELFAAVAQVLAFVMSRKKQGRAGGWHETPRLDEELPDILSRKLVKLTQPLD